MGKGTIVLAFSGGLDTSICVPLLKERYDYDRVVTVAVDVGQTEADIRMATEKGERIADRHVTIDARDRFVNEHVFRAIRANGSYEGYPMGTALARPLIAGQPGFVSLRLERGIETPNTYVLLVEWTTLEAHTEGFRRSPLEFEAGSEKTSLSEYKAHVWALPGFRTSGGNRPHA